MKALVTGSTGFVGSHIVRTLIGEGWSVRALVRSAKQAQTVLDSQVELIEGDLVNRASLADVGAGVDAVFHAGAQVAASADYLKTNLDGTRNLVEALRPSGIRRFVHVSSIAATGIRGVGRIDENYVCKPDLPYGISKLKVDEYLQHEARENNFPAVIVRPPTVYGPGERGNFLTLCQAIQSGRFLLIGSGRNRIDFCSVGNLVQVMLRAAASGRPGEIYLVADDPPLTFAESTAIIGELVGRPVSRFHLPRPLAYVAAYMLTAACRPLGRPNPLAPARVRTMSGDFYFNLDKARTELGYRSEDSFRDLAARTIEWQRGQGLLN